MYELKEELNIENMIYEIRGKQVMLDSDLAKLYQCKNGTKSINLAVNRNVKKFPNDFYFQLTNNETENLRFHFETSNSTTNYGGKRYNPYAFTEQGVAMLSSVLRSNKAIEMNIEIMRAFARYRSYLVDNKDISKKLGELDDKINRVFKYLLDKIQGFESNKQGDKSNKIGYKK